MTGWGAWLNDNLRCWRILQSIFDVLIHRYLMGCCINEQLFMKVRGNADIEAAFECNFGLFSFCLAGFQNEPVGTGVVAVLLCTRLNYCPRGFARKGHCVLAQPYFFVPDRASSKGVQSGSVRGIPCERYVYLTLVLKLALQLLHFLRF